MVCIAGEKKVWWGRYLNEYRNSRSLEHIFPEESAKNVAVS
jgi:hypothetical protein